MQAWVGRARHVGRGDGEGNPLSKIEKVVHTVTIIGRRG
jgi:hypothetical protein